MNTLNIMFLKEKKHLELLPIAYYFGWQPRGNYDGLPPRSESLRSFPHDLYKIEESLKLPVEKTDELLEALECAFNELGSKKNGDVAFDFKSPYLPFQNVSCSFQELNDFLELIANEGNEWLVILQENNELT